MVNIIKFGIVGCGRIGTRHAEHIFNNKRAELCVVCDIVKEKADELAKKYNARAVYDIKDVLKEDMGVVNICAPSGLHAEMSIKGLEEGKHVLCEKPMTLNLADADMVVEKEKETGKKFFLVKQNRYNPPIKVLKDIVYNKKLGRISLINCNVLWNRRKGYYEESDWKGTMKLDGGALMTQCSHFLDLMVWIGGKVKSVFAKMDNLSHPYMETEDTGFITLIFENGCIGSLQYTTCVYKKNMEGSMTVLGDKGSIKVGGEYLNTLDFWDVEDVEKPELEPGGPANDYGTYKGSMSNHDKVIENVVSALLDGEDIATNSLQGRESIEVMQAAYISALTNKEVELPLKGDNYSFKLNEQEPLSGNKKSV
ncbi:Gfo/Idh/MocA family oxidoreductase [Candidatus Woesearchaeota archaeon]|nr:Gfo/Idh/MocA family oxidoreductase [Candidatus Woesearchaeota archaeon]